VPGRDGAEAFDSARMVLLRGRGVGMTGSRPGVLYLTDRRTIPGGVSIRARSVQQWARTVCHRREARIDRSVAGVETRLGKQPILNANVAGCLSLNA